MFDQATITTDDWDGTDWTWLSGNEETNEADTKTGLDQLYGTKTVSGTLTTAVDGIETNTLSGTLLGTFEYSTTTADGWLEIETTWDPGNDETHEAGTTTGDDQCAGTATIDGA